MGRAAFLVAAVALTACVKRPPVLFGQRMPAGCTQETRTERCVGWMFDRMMMTIAFKPYHDDSIRAYVASIGERLARANHDTRRWTFRVLDDDEPQAFAGFNATVYITRGALAVLRDEAELAGVIAHEMGHTIAGHHRNAIDDAMRDVGETDLQKFRDLRYARDDEIQADEQAVIFLGRAGYDVHAVERMLRAIAGDDEDDEDASDDRHPVWRERIARVAALAARHPSGERFTERFNTRVAQLVIGEDSKNVAMVGTTMVFARAGVAIELPPETKSVVFRGMVIFAMPNEVVGTAQLVDRSLATTTNIANTKSHTEVKLTRDAAVTITIVKDDKGLQDPVAIAKSLVASSRTPRPEEVARLHSLHFDPTKPRSIWAR
jgi:predicted Zn-dependent protease